MFQFLRTHCLENKNNMWSGILKICVHLIKSIMYNLNNREKWKVKLCALCWLHLLLLHKCLWLKRVYQKNKHTILRQKLEPTMSVKD